MAHDLRFTSSFQTSELTAPWAQARSEHTSYVPHEDGDVADFDTTPKAATIRQQYRARLNGIGQFLANGAQRTGQGVSSTGIAQARRNLDTFGERVAGGKKGFFSTEIGLVYGPGKRALDQICQALEYPAIPMETRLDHAQNLAEGVVVCASGSVSNLITVAEELSLSTGGVKNTARKLFTEIVEQETLDFVRATHSDDLDFELYEIHYVNAYRNAIADTCGLEPRQDHFIPPELRPDAEWEADSMREFKAQIAWSLEHEMPAKVVHILADRCLADIHQHLANFRGRDLDENDVFTIYQKLQNDGLGHILSDHYGPLPPQVLYREIPRADHEESAFRLIENATLLQRAIARNLRTTGIVAPFKFEAVAHHRRGRFAIKKIDPQSFYCKEREYGATHYRPVQLADLTQISPHATIDHPGLVHAALKNTNDPTQLAQFHPKKVWQSIDDTSNPLEWLRYISRPEIQKYRMAAPMHDQKIKNYIQSRVRKLTTAEKADVLRHSLHGNDPVITADLLKIISGKIPPEVMDETFSAHELALAAREGFSDILIFLLDSDFGIDINKTDELGRTALHLCAVQDRADQIHTLIQADADCEIFDNEDRTPLMAAALEGRRAAVRALLENHAGVNWYNSCGCTALMCAAEGGDIETVRILLHAGAEDNMLTEDGHSAFQIARSFGHTAIAQLLKEHSDRMQMDETESDDTDPDDIMADTP